MLDQHAERRAPVADVVLADDAVAEEVEHAHQRVADDRGAQVADVHLLGDVRRRVVDDHRLDVGRRTRRPADRRQRRRRAASARNSAENVTLTKPGPAISSSEATPARTPDSTTDCARSRGVPPIRLARGSAPLIWASARSDGRTVGSAGAPPFNPAKTGSSRSEIVAMGSDMVSPVCRIASVHPRTFTRCLAPGVRQAARMVGGPVVWTVPSG